MADVIEIPIKIDESSFKIRTILENVELVMHFIWNGRAERWVMNLLAPDETPLVMGVPMNVNTELIERFEIIGLPPGRMLFLDESGKSQEAGRDDFGKRCRLFYMTSV